MHKATVNYIVDLGLLVSFICTAVTGILKLPGLVRSMGALPFNVITPLHDASGVALVLLVLAHLALHWHWLLHTTKGFFRKK